MIAVIFELKPNPGFEKAYFDTAEQLRPLLDDIDGFISIERFESLASPGKYLSLSFWEDEDAVLKWRNMEDHRIAQSNGRRRVFEDYRLRVASVERDYGLQARDSAPSDSRALHDSPH